MLVIQVHRSVDTVCNQITYVTYETALKREYCNISLWWSMLPYSRFRATARVPATLTLPHGVSR